MIRMVDDAKPPAPPQGQLPNHIVVLQAFKRLSHYWETCEACQVQVKPLGVMVPPIPGQPGIVRPTGDMQMIFTFKMPPKVIA